MAAKHDHLVLQFGVGSGDLGNRVVAMLMLAGEFGFDVEFHVDRCMGLGEPVKPPVALDGCHDHGNLYALVDEVRCTAQGCTVIVKDRAP